MYDAQERREKAVVKWETAVWKAENLIFIQLANRPIDQKRGTLKPSGLRQSARSVVDIPGCRYGIGRLSKT